MKKLILAVFFVLLIAGYCIAAALQVDFLLSGYRHPTSDEVLSGGKVETYLTGTTTLSALWDDKDKAATAANPVILDSSGKAEVFGDNVYDFKIYDSDDNLLETIVGVEYKAEAGVVSDAAYNESTWNNITDTAPSKNAVRDKIEEMISDTAYDESTWNGVTGTAPSKNAVRDQLQLEAVATLTTTGDMLYAATGNTLARIPVGSSGQILKLSGTTPTWGSPITLSTPQVTTAGTSITFSSIPSGLKRINIMPVAMSTNGNDDILVQIGTGGSVETSGYVSSYGSVSGGVSTASSTAGFISPATSSDVISGRWTLSLVDEPTNTWVISGTSKNATNEVAMVGGNISLSGELDTIVITTTGGSNTFDAGKVNISYE